MDSVLIEEKLYYLKNLLKKLEKRLEKYQVVKDEEEKETLFAAMSKFAEEIVETAIKINTILLEENDDFVSTYYDSFINLGKYYSCDETFLKKIASTTGFRNRISHEYDGIDKRITLRSFSQLPELYSSYIKFVTSLLK